MDVWPSDAARGSSPRPSIGQKRSSVRRTRLSRGGPENPSMRAAESAKPGYSCPRIVAIMHLRIITTIISELMHSRRCRASRNGTVERKRNVGGKWGGRTMDYRQRTMTTEYNGRQTEDKMRTTDNQRRDLGAAGARMLRPSFNRPWQRPAQLARPSGLCPVPPLPR